VATEEKKPGYYGVCFEIYLESAVFEEKATALICLNNMTREVFHGMRKGVSVESSRP